MEPNAKDLIPTPGIYYPFIQVSNINDRARWASRGGANSIGDGRPWRGPCYSWPLALPPSLVELLAEPITLTEVLRLADTYKGGPVGIQGPGHLGL